MVEFHILGFRLLRIILRSKFKEKQRLLFTEIQSSDLPLLIDIAEQMEH